MLRTDDVRIKKRKERQRRGVTVPWAGRPAGQLGSSPGPGGAGRSAWPPRGPGESPPAAASHWLPPPPGTLPLPGSAARNIRIT